MRTKLLMPALLLAGGSYLFAENIEVTPDDYVEKYTYAMDGDVLLMATGDYSNRLQFPSGKTITFKAAENAQPIIKGDIQSSNSTTDGGLIFDGVEINRGGEAYFVDVTLKDITQIIFRNTTISNVSRCAIRAVKVDGTNSIGKIEFDNCIIKDCGAGNWNFIYTQHAVKELTTKNSTLYNYINGESFFCVYAANPTNVMNFLFENNTVYKWGKDSTRALAKIGGNYNIASTYTFRNNIINEPGATQLPMIVDATSGTIIGENNLIVNYGGYNGGSSQSINDLTLEGLGLTEIGFLSPETGNFSILANSPITTAATHGGPIGDPRWVVSISNPTTLTTISNNATIGTTIPAILTDEKGSSVTAIATPNYGSRFLEWQDSDGNTVSTESTYTFNLNEDTQLTAIFEPTATFITGWNFSGRSERNDFTGDCYADEANRGMLSLYNVNSIDKINGTAPFDNTLNGVTYTAFRKWGPLDGTSRHFIAEFSVSGYDNITVSSYLGPRNGYTNFYKTQIMEYSTDMETYHELVRKDIDNSQWHEFSAMLPTLPAGTEKVYIRWTIDPAKGLVSGEQTAGGESELMIANVLITADKASATSYTRDCYVDGAFETICLPFNVTSITNGLGNAVTPTLYEYNTHAAGSNQVGFKSATSIQANTPYLIAFPEDNNIEKLPFTFSGTTAEAKTPAKEAGSYIFTGTYNKFAGEDTYYVLNSTGDGFVKAAATTFVAAYRAYLSPVDGGSAGARQLSVVFDDGGATDIEEEIAQSGNEPTTEIIHVYTIDGRLVRQVQPNTGVNPTENLAKGIYIVNNKKVVVQ